MAINYKNSAKTKEGVKLICQNKKCASGGKPLPSYYFFESRNELGGYNPYCRDCIEQMIDKDNLKSVCDMLETIDYPFIIKIWNLVCLKNKKNYFFNYIEALDKKSEYDFFRYKDSVFNLTQEEEEKIEEFDETVEEHLKGEYVWSDEWHGEYLRSDLQYLNDYYSGLTRDYKITTTNHKDYAKKIAQASLSQEKAYQRVLKGEDGAESSYEKATKLFDMLSKSAQFAESQRGANDVSLGCFGRVFDAVEKHNWVPQHVPDDEDMYDKLLKQFSNIERSL